MGKGQQATNYRRPACRCFSGLLTGVDHAFRNDYPALRDKMLISWKRLSSRYILYVGIWKVCSGLHIVGDVPISTKEMVDLTRTASLLVRQYRRGARTMIELDDLFGDLAAKQAGSLGGI